MKKNLETADRLVKLILAATVSLAYFTGAISGPVARVLMILGLVVIFIFIVKGMWAVFLRD